MASHEQYFGIVQQVAIASKTAGQLSTMTTTASLLLVLAIAGTLLLAPVTDAFLPSPKHTTTTKWSIQPTADALLQVLSSSSSPENDFSPSPSDLSWLRKAMDSTSSPEPDGLVLVEAEPGISGFAVDPELGFVVVLVGGRSDRATYAVVSPKDKRQVRSAEALCLVQLAGGLDLGTPILPPDILARLVAEETGGQARALRPHVKLLRIDVVANEDESKEKERLERVISKVRNPAKSSAERDSAIETQAPKVFAAVRKLPGLLDCNQEQVIAAMKVHADESGKLDLPSYNAFLDILRSTVNWTEPSKVKFKIVVSVKGEEMTMDSPSAVVAVGLALRYKVDVVLSEECQTNGFDVVEIASRFPAFRPIQELYEDAKIMDGFIPSMFNQAAAPDNDDKMRTSVVVASTFELEIMNSLPSRVVQQCSCSASILVQALGCASLIARRHD